MWLPRSNITYSPCSVCGLGSVNCTATGYRLDGPGIEFRWWRNFPNVSRLSLGPTQPPVIWVTSLFRGKERPGREDDRSLLLGPWSRKSRFIPLLVLWAVRLVQCLRACTRVQFTFLLYRCSV